MTSHWQPTHLNSIKEIQCKIKRIRMEDATEKLDNAQKEPCKRNKRTSKKKRYALMSTMLVTKKMVTLGCCFTYK